MGFEIKINISEESPEGRKIREVMKSENISPEEVVQRSIRLYSMPSKTPAQELLGAFSSDEDAKVTDEALAAGKEITRMSLREF